MSSPVFQLPEALATKAKPSLIAADEQHLAAVAASVEAQLGEVSAQLAELRRATAGAGQRALDRDLEIHRLSARARLLRRYRQDLCLGRMVTDEAVMYVGRLGITDPAGEPLLVDWRTRAAEPYFAATLARPLGLRSRRRYRWNAGRITDYWDEVFDTDQTGGPELDGREAALDAESAFIASLGASRSPRMRDVLATIAADQDAIIRAGSHGTLVVEGGPGTGKTVVALHRAAYLLYADPRLRDHRRGGVLFVGPHRPYLAYIADVLPSLGEEGVQTCTLRDLVAEGATVGPDPDPEVARLKASTQLVEAIEPAVRLYEEPPTERLLVETPWIDVAFGPVEWATAFASVDPALPHNEARDQVWDELVSQAVERCTDRSFDDDGNDEVPAEALRWALERDPDLRRTYLRAWTVIEATDLVGDLWSVPAYLRRCAPGLTRDEIASLQRSDPAAWTLADLPLLDAARHRLGDPEVSRRRRRREIAVAAERAAMDGVVDDLLRADDGSGLVQALRQSDLRDALVDQAALPDRNPDELAGPFAHIVVDEAQELTDAEWLMLVRRCPARSFTVVGDRAQARHGFAESWVERLTRIGLHDVTEAALTINYRTPAEVMAEAEPVIRAVVPDANVPTSIRSSGDPVVRGSVAELGAIVTGWLAAHAEGIACVITPAAVAVSLPEGLVDSPRVEVLTPEHAKGLEFDLVVVIDDAAEGYEAVVDRYVAMTRATQQLVVLRSGG